MEEVYSPTDPATFLCADIPAKWGALNITRFIGLTLLTIVILIGNSIVILAVISSKKLRAILPSYFIVNLAVADLLLGLTAIPLHLYVLLFEPEPLDVFLCKSSIMTSTLTCAASVYSLSVIAIDRYIGISRPLTYSKFINNKSNIFLIIGVWLIAGVLAGGTSYLWPDLSNAEDPLTNCNEWMNDYMDPFVAIVLAISLSLPLGLTVILYWKIYKKLALREKQIKKGTIGAIQLRVHTGGRYSYSYSSTSAYELHSEKKVSKMLAIVVGAFVICWLPYTAVTMATVLPLSDTSVDLYDTFSWLMYVGFFNSCVNPFIYAVNSNSFRFVFKKLLKCKRLD